MSRYLALPFLSSALSRGKSAQQLLSMRRDAQQTIACWLSLRTSEGKHRVTLYEVLYLDELDYVELPFVNEAHEDEPPEHVFDTLDDALAFIEKELGGSRDKFVNEGVIQDEMAEALGSL
jgi:hypothetical protein